MKLKSIKIVGFRSIEKMDFLFTGYGHKVLVGKNESGKSNILKALNLLSGEVGFKGIDKKTLHNGSAYVIFSFDLDDHEIDICKKPFYKKFLVDKKVMLTARRTIEDFFNSNAKYILYTVSRGKKGVWSNWKLPADTKTQDIWYVIEQSINGTGYEMRFPAGKFINENSIGGQLNEAAQNEIRTHLTPVGLNEIFNFLRAEIKKAAAPDDYKFETLYWSYNSVKNDLPPHVNREEFSHDPNTCMPLKNMFLLAGISEDEIGTKINEEFNNGFNYIRTLLDDVNGKVNEYIHGSWEEVKNIKIELRSDGDNIVIGVQDSKNSYDFKQRSDGFRRFIYFLLLMSAGINKKQIRNTLILIDEPEIGLHPSSSKCLRNKLIELGDDNIIVYATHSIYMIDTENIENNLIVTRENETTKFEIAKEDGTSPAENVYQSIGHSIYDDLKKKNILLEGYTDKKLLKPFMVGRNWKHFGICYTGGVKNIKHVCSMLSLADRKYFVLSDADDSANQKKRELENSEFWYTYKDLGCDAVTIEDFYHREFFYKTVNEILKEYQIEVSGNFENNKVDSNRMASIKGSINKFIQNNKGIVEKNKCEDANQLVGKIMHDIKERCPEKRKKGDVLDKEVKDMLEKFMEKLNNAK